MTNESLWKSSIVGEVAPGASLFSLGGGEQETNDSVQKQATTAIRLRMRTIVTDHVGVIDIAGGLERDSFRLRWGNQLLWP
jgi:hypothetical protein